MTIIEPGPTAGLVERVRNILLRPGAEWDKIATERASLQTLLSSYILPLALIAAIASFIGMSVFGIGGFGFSVRIPIVAGALSALLQLVMSLVGVWALGLIINMLAPNFGSTQDEVRANQLSAYSATAGLVGSFAMILPALSILALVGAIYSLVLLYIGLPRMMRTPEDKRIGYFVTIIVIAIVAGIVAGTVLGAVRGALAPIGGGFAAGGMFGARQPEQAEVQLPGGGSISMSELERTAKQMEEAAANPEAAAAAAAISADRLRSLLPEALPGGWSRTEISTGTTGAMGGVANASGVYERGDARIELSVTDLGAMGGMAAMAGAFGAQGSRETADGYEKAGPVNGRFTIEELDRPAHTAKYGVIAARRIMLQADGRNVSVEEVRAAVEAIGVSRAEALAAQPAPNALPPGAPAPG
jgi:hypothetical protein